MTGVFTKSKNGTTNNFGAYIFFFLYAVFVIYLCYTLNIWIDETYTLDTTSYNLKGVIRQSYNFEGQPPAYFIILSWWRIINQGAFFARLFSVLCTGLAAWFFYKTIRLIVAEKNAVWFVILFLLNPFTVWVSTQMRLYAFLLLLTVLSLYFFFNFFLKGKKSYLLSFAIIAIIGVYTQYLYVFMLASLGVSVLIFKGWKIFFTYTIYLVPATLIFLKNVLFTTNPMELAYVGSLQSSFSTRLISILHSPQNLLLASDTLSFPRLIRTGITIVLVFVLLYAFLIAFKKDKTINQYNKSTSVILISGSCLVLCIALFFAATGVDYNDRYLTVGFPFLILILLVVNNYSFIKRVIVICTISVYYLFLLFSIYRHPVNDFDSKALASYISANEQKDEPILFYPKVLALPFQYYYKGNNAVIPLPGSIKFDSTYLSKIKDSFELKAAIANIHTASNSYILITNRNEPNFSNDADIKIMNNYILQHYNITVDTLFYGKLNSLRVRRINKK